MLVQQVDVSRTKTKHRVSTQLEHTNYLSSSSRRQRVMEVSTVGTGDSFVYLKWTSAEEVMKYKLPLISWNPPKTTCARARSRRLGGRSWGTAVAYNKYGKGQAVYIGVPVFPHVPMGFRSQR